jgi:hypothetical protein
MKSSIIYSGCDFLEDQRHAFFKLTKARNTTDRVLGPTNFGVGAEVEKGFSYSKTSVTTLLGKCSEVYVPVTKAENY